jgi:hypothetical protein
LEIGTRSLHGNQVEVAVEGRPYFSAARLASCILENNDPIPSLCSQLRDLSHGEFHCHDVLSRLYPQPDPRSAPVLLLANQNEPNGSLVNLAIELLGGLRFPESVDALIESFNAPFDGKGDWKRPYTPEKLRQNVAESLAKLTGQTFLADKAKCEGWWQTNRGPIKK